MYSDSFKELYDNLYKGLIVPKSYYSAHRNESGIELLEDHSQLCGNYFLYFIENLELEPLIDNLIIDLFGKNNLLSIKQILLFAVYYHDIGKINSNFQKVKVNSKKSSSNSNHSIFSEKVLTSFLLNEFPNQKSIIYLIGTVVSLHHTKLRDFSIKDYDESQDEIKIIQQIIQDTGLEIKEISKDEKFDFYSDNYSRDKIFIFVKLFYSLLVLSDSYSSMHYANSMKSMHPLNVIDSEIREKMIKSYSGVSYNANIDDITSGDISSCNNINELRKEILVECNDNMKRLVKDGNKIFMLSVPTGGGKTNISMKLVLNILEHDNSLKRIFYVFPFINIIEQNYKSIDNTLFNDSYFPNKLGLISDIYSRAYVNKYENMSDTDDSDFKLEQMLLIQNDNFLNNCVNVISNVNFFNSFIKNGGNNRYKIANMCNSVVVIDEIQTLSDKNIRTFYNFIKETSESLNIYYIIMSATLPDFNYFLDNVTIPQVINNPLKYYNHPIFKRNSIIFKKNSNDIDSIKKLLIEEIKVNYATGGVKVLITLNVVDTSRRVFDELRIDDDFNGFSFYLLNSTTSTLRRKKIIENIKKCPNGERIIIVSTQSIEAGVDIDCDFGIRDYSILDSIEQISGRINRECDAQKADISKLFVIKYKDGDTADSKKIYGNQERYKILNNMEDGMEEEILSTKHFDTYYGKLSEEVKKIARDNFKPIQGKIANLQYQSINNELDVIDTKVGKVDIFICDEIPLNNLSKYDREKIRALINDPRIVNAEKDAKIIIDDVIISSNVYVVWKEILSSTNKFEDVYIRRKITSLFNQFVISITNIKNNAYDSDLFDFLQTEGFVEVDERFDVVLSTPKFLEYYSFDDGLKSYEIKEAINNRSMGVIL
ncbi:CRISPR-associated helicase/endonuclease Cas3 [Methanococcoides burtonii]|uniref:CRISPR-associated helicase Cas3 n=1 Tax=Methanococcoides burtonii (strain DSM 6242 / NBRC 107633 / OCM 468 / ACE-M) TaxID=259564 RepID=Q12WX5_METBU|nr:CRISPR-associated helicase/endonuclease Cas3 [Methanococcoides burtonii]ABE52051.1 CRISPR-associated helicase Cas3 [Methanococcoides burtonii DSM 6242]